jgi:hypothetical protein
MSILDHQWKAKISEKLWNLNRMASFMDVRIRPYGKKRGTDHVFWTCPSYLFALPEIIDNSSTIHYSRSHYGNENFNTFGLCSVAVKGQKSAP